MANDQTNQDPRVLIVEDDKLIGQAYQDGLERAGYPVYRVMSCLDANEFLKAKKPDIILLDLILPGKDGFDFLEELRNNDKTKDIPVVVLTNIKDEVAIDHTKELGAIDYIVKSESSLRQVVNKVSEYLGK